MGEPEAIIDGGESAMARVQETRERVLRALRLVERCESDALDGLQSALCAYVGALAAEGLSAELVTAEVRALVAAPAAPDDAEQMSPTVREALMELALAWCGTEYARSREAARARGTAAADLTAPPADLAPPPAAPDEGLTPPT